MDDLISRQAAIDEIKAVYEWHDVVTEDRMIQHFKALPSVQEQRWIPVTEKLPEEYQAYIVTDERQQSAYEYYYNPEDEFTKKHGWRCSGRKIVAWMPLPEPYKGEK